MFIHGIVSNPAKSAVHVVYRSNLAFAPLLRTGFMKVNEAKSAVDSSSAAAITNAPDVAPRGIAGKLRSAIGRVMW